MISKLFSNGNGLADGCRLNEFVANPKRALWTLAGPIIFGLLFQSLYLIVDTFFVIKVGHEAVAAITFAMPVFFILIAFVTGFGMGVTSLISKYIGGGHNEKASEVAHHAVIVGILLGMILSLIGYILTPTIFSVLGAKGHTLTLAIQYFKIVSLGSLFLVSSAIFRSILAGEGNHVAPTTILVMAAIINLILDPIFIIVLDWGIKGAAWATFFGFTFSFVAYFIFLFIKNSSFFNFNFGHFDFNIDILKKIFKIGAPVAISQILLSGGIMFMNFFAAQFGNRVVAGFGLASRLESFYSIFLIGISSALLTILGMFLGAKRYDLIQELLKYTMKMVLYISLGVGLILYFISGLFLSIFTKDPFLIAIGMNYFKIMSYAYPIFGLTYIYSKVFQIAGHPHKELLVNLFRLVVFFVPLVLIFTKVLDWGVEGIWYARLLATTLSLIIGAFFYKKVIREIKGFCE